MKLSKKWYEAIAHQINTARPEALIAVTIEEAHGVQLVNHVLSELAYSLAREFEANNPGMGYGSNGKWIGGFNARRFLEAAGVRPAITYAEQQAELKRSKLEAHMAEARARFLADAEESQPKFNDGSY